MGEIFFAFSKARCFGRPKHNLALPNHTACRLFMPPALYNRQIKKFPTEKQNVSLKHILT